MPAIGDAGGDEEQPLRLVSSEWLSTPRRQLRAATTAAERRCEKRQQGLLRSGSIHWASR